MKKISVVCLCIIILSGCASAPLNSIQTYDGLRISLPKADDKLYRFVDERGRVISTARGQDSTLNFTIPPNIKLNQCFDILNQRGRTILGEKGFMLPLIGEYRKLQKLKSPVERELEKMADDNKRVEASLSQTHAALDRNRAFNGKNCRLPDEKPWPPMPATKCGSHAQCLDEGGAICYSKFMGAEGCSIALKELNVSGMLGNPGCAALASEAAGQKYGLDDAFIDFLHGAVDDVSDDMLESDSWLEVIGGGVVKFLNYSVKIERARVCTEQFVEHFYGPKRRWNETVNEIRAEPAQTNRQCNSLVRDYNDYVSRKNSQTQRSLKLSQSLGHLNAIKGFLTTREYGLSVCDKPTNSAMGIVRDQSVKRYLIGIALEKVAPDDKLGGAGVKVTRLVEGSPAELAGLKEGDIITRADGVYIREVQDLINYVQEKKESKLDLTHVRGGTPHTLTVTPSASIFPIEGL